jgi:hypothetical protein
VGVEEAMGRGSSEEGVGRNRQYIPERRDGGVSYQALRRGSLDVPLPASLSSHFHLFVRSPSKNIVLGREYRLTRRVLKRSSGSTGYPPAVGEGEERPTRGGVVRPTGQ